MSSPKDANIVYLAISLSKRPKARCQVSLELKGTCVVLHFSSGDIGSLRASINASLRELKMAAAAISFS